MADIQVKYIDHMGDDITVVNAARVSFDQSSGFYVDSDTGRWELEAKDARLIRYLAEHNHFTPFTHCTITLLETVPIFVARERFRHTVGFSYNEISRRYVKTPPEFYVPEYWREKPAGSIKQGSSGMHNLTDDIQEAYTKHLEVSYQMYNAMIDAGVAPEMARMVLPQSCMTSYYVTGSLAAFARLYKLRSSADAQKEIQTLAQGIHECIEPLFPVSWKVLTE